MKEIKETKEKYFEFADMMTKGRFSTMSNKGKLKYIFDTEEGMLVPFKRREDYNWILRNFLIHNARHPLADVVMGLVKEIVKAESYN